jgi:hypothetical protein
MRHCEKQSNVAITPCVIASAARQSHRKKREDRFILRDCRAALAMTQGILRMPSSQKIWDCPQFIEKGPGPFFIYFSSGSFFEMSNVEMRSISESYFRNFHLWENFEI